MQKRREPLLDFIRSVIRPVIGVMTSVDVEEYDNAINELQYMTDKITLLKFYEIRPTLSSQKSATFP